VNDTVVREAFTKPSSPRKHATKRRQGTIVDRGGTPSGGSRCCCPSAAHRSPLSPVLLAADGPVRQFPQTVTLGLYCGQVISYLDFGPVRLSRGNKVAPTGS
jgi:hypothetical protein